jgi:hypothetical protein
MSTLANYNQPVAITTRYGITPAELRATADTPLLLVPECSTEQVHKMLDVDLRIVPDAGNDSPSDAGDLRVIYGAAPWTEELSAAEVPRQSEVLDLSEAPTEGKYVYAGGRDNDLDSRENLPAYFGAPLTIQVDGQSPRIYQNPVDAGAVDVETAGTGYTGATGNATFTGTDGRVSAISVTYTDDDGAVDAITIDADQYCWPEHAGETFTLADDGDGEATFILPENAVLPWNEGDYSFTVNVGVTYITTSPAADADGRI